MYAVASQSVAIGLMLICMFILGSWPNGFKIAFAKHKLARLEYAFLDFGLGFIVVGIVGGITFGSTGPASPDLSANIQSSSAARILISIASGLLLTVANLCYVLSTQSVGMTIPMFIQGGLGIMLGSTINYFIEPDKSQPGLLFGGVAAAFLAVCMSAAISYEMEKIKQKQQADDVTVSAQLAAVKNSGEVAIEMKNVLPSRTSSPPNTNAAQPAAVQNTSSASPVTASPASESPESSANTASRPHTVTFHFEGAETDDASQPGLSASAVAVEVTIMQPRGTVVPAPSGEVVFETKPTLQATSSTEEQPKPEAAVSYNAGLVLAISSGICCGTFGALFNLSTNESRVDSTPLTAYSSFLFFTISFCVSSFLLVCAKLYWTGVSKAPIREWIALPKGLHVLLLLSGMLCAIGNVIGFLAGGYAGFAASSAISQCNSLVGAIYGLVYWKEFRGANGAAKIYTTAMFALYGVAIALISLSVKSS